jgi:hypothetical protein
MRVTLTDHSALKPGPAERRSRREVVEYLEQDPSHAVVIHVRRPIYVLRGASERLDNFYYGEWAESMDPNDANGGDLTAREAVNEAVEMATPSNYIEGGE